MKKLLLFILMLTFLCFTASFAVDPTARTAPLSDNLTQLFKQALADSFMVLQVELMGQLFWDFQVDTITLLSTVSDTAIFWLGNSSGYITLWAEMDSLGGTPDSLNIDAQVALSATNVSKSSTINLPNFTDLDFLDGCFYHSPIYIPASQFLVIIGNLPYAEEADSVRIFLTMVRQ